MAEVFTISGAEPYEMGASSEKDIACAQNVKGVFIAGVGMKVAAVPVGIFGTYKMFKQSWGAGVASLLGMGALWFFGGRLVYGAARSFANCSGRPMTSTPSFTLPPAQ